MLLFLAWPLSVTNAQNQAGNTITYQCKNEKLANALRRVERLSDYYKMQFSVDEVSAYKVTVSLKDAAIEDAVRELLQNTKLQYNIKGRFIQIYRDAPRQGGNVASGRIIDANGEPLPSAVVKVKETGNGVAANLMQALFCSCGQSFLR